MLAVVGVLASAGLLSVAFVDCGKVLAAVVIALLGVVLLVTGSTEVRPIYRALGVTTRGHDGEREAEAPVEKPA